MKKILALLLSGAMLLVLVSCTNNSSTTSQSSETSAVEQSTKSSDVSKETSTATVPEVTAAETETETESPSKETASETETEMEEASQELSSTSGVDNTTKEHEASSEYSLSINMEGITSTDELKTRMEEDLTGSIEALKQQWMSLSKEIETYEQYCDNAEKVSAFYQVIVTDTEKMCIMLKEYSAAYSRVVLDSDMDNDEKYKEVDGINDDIYEDACDEINDEIYEGLLDDMYEYLCEGVLEDQPDNVDFDEWYDIYSAEYDQWYDTSSEVFDLYYDTSSDIYSFYSDMSSEIYSEDYERAEEKYQKFLKTIAKDKGMDTGDSEVILSFDTTIRDAADVDELETVIDKHVSECIQALRGEWQTISADIDTMQEYTDNVDSIEDFHFHLVDSTTQILNLISNYGVVYSEMIFESGASAKEMYKSFEDMRDCLYEDACEMVRDEIYDDLLAEVQDYYYDGIIKQAQDSLEYSEWSDFRSDAYSWWSDARGDVYSKCSDTRSELYSYISDVRSELFSGDIDGAKEELEKYRQKIGGAEKAIQEAEEESLEEPEKEETEKEETEKEETEEPEEETPEETSTSEALLDIEDWVTLISLSLPDTDGDGKKVNHTIEREGNLITVKVWQDGLTELAETVGQDKETYGETWNNSVVESFRNMCETFKSGLDDAGFTDYNVSVMVLNDQNTDLVLLSVMNGQVVYNIIDEY